MPLIAILLLFGSAVLHTTWNLLLKRAADRNIVTWWAVLVGSGLFLPVLIFTGLPQGSVWILLLISVLIEIVYFLTLSSAYGVADFSLVYPFARGAAPAWIALWSVWLLGEHLTPGGILGLVTIIAGLLVIGASELVKARRAKLLQASGSSWKGLLLAGLLSILISAYSTVDAAAVQHNPVLPYTVMVFFLAPVLTAPAAVLHYRPANLLRVWRLQPGMILAIGLLTVSAYLLTLLAYALAPLGYSGAIREVSVVLGAFAGWRFLGEKMGPMRLAGAGIVFAGILMIALLG